MFGTFFNYNLMVKVSPRKALGEPGTGRYAFRFRTGQNYINYSHSDPNSSFLMNANAMFGLERVTRPKRALSGYWGLELGGGIYVNTNIYGDSFSGGPAASLLYGFRYRIKPRWTVAVELAPTASVWYNKSNGSWQVPVTHLTLSGQSIGISGVYRI